MKYKTPVLEALYMTKSGFEGFQKELEQLAATRKEAVLKLTEARNMGDLSENGLYTAAKSRLRGIDGRMLFLKNVLKRAQVPKKDKNIVSIGSLVTLKIGNFEKKYTIVGDFEANPLDGKISYKSPLGSVIFGRKEKEQVIFVSPEGEKSVVIVALE